MKAFQGSEVVARFPPSTKDSVKFNVGGGQGFRRLKARPKFHAALPRDHESSKSINCTLPTWLFGDNGKENGNYYGVRV